VGFVVHRLRTTKRGCGAARGQVSRWHRPRGGTSGFPVSQGCSTKFVVLNRVFESVTMVRSGRRPGGSRSSVLLFLIRVSPRSSGPGSRSPDSGIGPRCAAGAVQAVDFARDIITTSGGTRAAAPGSRRRGYQGARSNIEERWSNWFLHGPGTFKRGGVWVPATSTPFVVRGCGLCTAGSRCVSRQLLSAQDTGSCAGKRPVSQGHDRVRELPPTAGAVHEPWWPRSCPHSGCNPARATRWIRPGPSRKPIRAADR